jgi:hypothetical protein
VSASDLVVFPVPTNRLVGGAVAGLDADGLDRLLASPVAWRDDGTTVVTRSSSTPAPPSSCACPASTR